MREMLWVAGVLALAGCGDEPRATAELMNAAGTKVATVMLVEKDGAVELQLEATGLDPGTHGIHFHAVGLCEGPAFTSAGAHFNPLEKQHGLESPTGAHAGDLPNLEVDASGKATTTMSTNRVRLSEGQLSVFDADGTALVIHARADDQVTDPSGNSGDRIACGVLRKSE
ncbi:superoxide dismutase family protein [Hyalangium rubrum]|uniref:Superoxide dismutase family protein n=1 Tax=Hyalangium rubrum TaxID=3103134 RepID=A0ABU5HEG1_9BACT|nr:superoxide dismutase family protein [Hyalangium sp. s54d21]MDY7231254.1 superoxide dismutase family protein [Hyalangium sp. s54d21]